MGIIFKNGFVIGSLDAFVPPSTPTPTPTNTVTPTNTFTPTPSITPTNTITPTPSVTTTITPTPTTPETFYILDQNGNIITNQNGDNIEFQH